MPYCLLSFVAGATAALVIKELMAFSRSCTGNDDDNDDDRRKPGRTLGAEDRLHGKVYLYVLPGCKLPVRCCSLHVVWLSFCSLFIILLHDWLTAVVKNALWTAGATAEGDDLSLFYGDVRELTTITPSQRVLPKDVYGKLVNDAVVCCVDIVLVRTVVYDVDATMTTTTPRKKKECLLVERSSEPVKGVWWWPGGRLLKGETFFAAAIRKANEETGIPKERVRPVQVLGVWNTFFPTSAWDNDMSKGTQTVNPIVLVEINTSGPEDGEVNIELDGTSENYRWILLDPDAARDEDPYVQQALLRLRAWNPNYCDE
jgi:8-oxo-dGTP pyrophosphatase MutT (NUDIX family)